MNNMTEIDVKMASITVSNAPDILIARGVGSCMIVMAYDKGQKIGGMLHAMLPTKGPTDNNSAKYVDSGFDLLVSELKKKGVTNVKNLRLGLQVLQICFLV